MYLNRKKTKLLLCCRQHFHHVSRLHTCTKLKEQGKVWACGPGVPAICLRVPRAIPRLKLLRNKSSLKLEESCEDATPWTYSKAPRCTDDQTHTTLGATAPSPCLGHASVVLVGVLSRRLANCLFTHSVPPPVDDIISTGAPSLLLTLTITPTLPNLLQL